MGVKWKPPECQLRVVEGLPGAGKSFFLVKQTADVILREKRPVYTNLPIRFRVFRTWLRNRAGEQYANLIVELTEAHWTAFLKRNKAKQEYQQQYKTDCKNSGVPFRRGAFERAWIEKAGRDILRPGQIKDELRIEYTHAFEAEGVEYEEHWFESWYESATKDIDTQPNWIPPLSVVIIDEVQHWHPMERNIKQNDAEGLKAYLTMMRHHLHDVWVATQVWGNVSKTMRDLARQFMRVQSLSERKVLYGVRYKHLGLRGISYALYSIEQLNAQLSKGGAEDDFGSTPLKSELCFPGLPWHQFWFRLYDSFTHVESPRRMLEKLKRMQAEAGIHDLEAHIEASRQSMKEDRLKKFAKWCMTLITLTCVMIMGTTVGAAVVGQNPQQLAEDGKPIQATPGVNDGEVVQWWPEDGRVTGIGSKGVMTTNGDVQIGGRFGNGRLRHADAVGRRTLWVAGDNVWVWKLGNEFPERVAGRAELDNLNRLSQLVARSQAGAPVDPAGPDGGGVVGSSGGDPDSR